MTGKAFCNIVSDFKICLFIILKNYSLTQQIRIEPNTPHLELSCDKIYPNNMYEHL